MSDSTTETRSIKTRTLDDGSTVNEVTDYSDPATEAKYTAVNLVWYVYGLISLMLGLRFMLKIFGANPNNEFAELTYSITGLLTAPFDTIFGVSSTTTGDTQSIFEPSILVALAVYGLVAWAITKLITINEK